MKQATGLVLALAGASPALADGFDAKDIKLSSQGLPINVQTNQQDETAALAEGRSLLGAGNAAQAISAFRVALGQNAGSVAALNGIAIAYDRLGRIDLARQHFEMALALEPDAGDIAYNLGWTLHRAGLHRDAIAWLQRASSSDDGRAAAAARRALLLVAAALENAALAPVIAAEAPVRVASARIEAAQASARIDMASSGEAVLVLPGAASHSLNAPQLAVAQRAGGVPVARINASLAPARAGELPQLAAPITLPQDDEAALQAPALIAANLDELAALTIPMPALSLAEATPAAPTAITAAVLLPQVINVTDVPPDFSPLLAAAEPMAAVLLPSFQPAPLRLLDLAALPELATATPLAPPRFLVPAAVAIDWLAGFDASRFAVATQDRTYRRLVNALSAQADLADIDDKGAVRLAIARLEALVARIGALNA
ncbi:tetratricopeptide repeat protein [Sandarakinorhabdus sp. AAP62]|uniref:tetratricopeptide repeat protein n=1 Tax=Sandarakinorhabdus sp. AAP62 TaxID=1248916 RepID=UPI0002D435F9|nr:tetratricopeptide repeat protein [Sandarakinorhabdus sp. AAP62]